ncbi:dCTP deaminase [Palleronia marisminoris]
MLSSAGIVERLQEGTVEISPFSEVQLRGASYVLRLGNRFRRWMPGSPLRLWEPNAAGSALAVPETADNLSLEPSALVLGCTRERIRLADGIAGQLSPLSHVARFGLGVTCGADFINPGFGSSGASLLTLELYNHNVRPLELRAGMPIAHLRLISIGAVYCGDPQRSIYEGSDPLTDPLLYEEWGVSLGLDVENPS